MARFLMFLAVGVCVWLGWAGPGTAEEHAFLYFDADHAGGPNEDVPQIQPWRVVQLDPAHGGLWVVAGDLDGDGQPELVSAENVDVADNHYTSAVAAQKLDGTVLWTWGDPDIGRKTWHHDVACQIHDWNGNGRNDVIVIAKDALIELDGATGEELRRIPIEEHASDCLVFCNLSGGPRKR